MVTFRSKMYWIMMYAVIHIQENLRSIDFLNNNTQKVDGKIPFYDDAPAVIARRGQMPFVRDRPKIHLKDSWNIRFTVKEKDNSAIVYLTNSKKTKTGNWVVADLLWYGTQDYQTDAPTIKIDVPVFYEDVIFSTVPGVGMTQAESLRKLKKYHGKDVIRQILKAGHHTGKMTFYNRYTGNMNYNRTFRRGIRNQLVQSFQEYILLCVENGIRTAINEMVDEGILKVGIRDIKVRILR